MKKLFLMIILAGTISITFAIGTETQIQMKDEANVADIPFNTEAIVRNLMNDPTQTKAISLKEESYIDDIPFNTAEIANASESADELNKIILNEETYIDDIPFSTQEIVNNLK
jgi:hypothetical protein